MLKVIVRAFLIMALLLAGSTASAASLFHAYVTDLSPPYMCQMSLKAARGVTLDTKHTYIFGGICKIKLPVGNTWTYQTVWVDSQADWDSETGEAVETNVLANDLGTIVVHLKCTGDPWLSKSNCAIIGYQNTTQFTNFSGVFNPRTGQYPPFTIMTGQYPPLARNQAEVQEAAALSVRTARQEADAAHAAFAQTFLNQPHHANITLQTEASPSRKVFLKPLIGGIRLDSCLRLNSECGKPAADRFCQTMGFARSSHCKIDSQRTTPTFIIGTKSICRQSFCRGFEEIECVK